MAELVRPEPGKRRFPRARLVLGAIMAGFAALVFLEIDPLPPLGIDLVLENFLQSSGPIEFDWRYQLISQLANFVISSFFAFLLLGFVSEPQVQDDLNKEESSDSGQEVVVRRM